MKVIKILLGIILIIIVGGFMGWITQDIEYGYIHRIYFYKDRQCGEQHGRLSCDGEMNCVCLTGNQK
jgi:hypothetical protein